MQLDTAPPSLNKKKKKKDHTVLGIEALVNPASTVHLQFFDKPIKFYFVWHKAFHKMTRFNGTKSTDNNLSLNKLQIAFNINPMYGGKIHAYILLYLYM